jgi:hypothetical protein
MKCAPAVVIRLEVESRPKFALDALNEGEADRLSAWISSSRELAAWVAAGLQLASAAPGAILSASAGE